MKHARGGKLYLDVNVPASLPSKRTSPAHACTCEIALPACSYGRMASQPDAHTASLDADVAGQWCSEMAYSRNRRAEFVITWGDDGSIRGTTE